MMVANSFDLWQKDAFFSAAEEVQESTDIMESAYRLWIKEQKLGLTTTDSTELCRELQVALGTAKWQLEEFEKATRLSQGHRCDDITATRHKQFIAAIENQISLVEAALREAFVEEGKQPLRWVNLDEEERDDLAIFLSGTSPSFQPAAKGILSENYHKTKEADPDASAVSNGDICEMKISNDYECSVEVEDGGSSGRSDDISCEQEKAISARRIWSSPNVGSLKIVIDDKYEERNELTQGIEATPKVKGSKPFYWKQRCQEHYQAKGALKLLNQTFGWVGGLQRQLQSPVQLQMSCSLQFALALMIAIFLIVPFVLYSS